MSDYSTADPYTEVISYLSSHPDVTAAFGGVSPVVEAPFPHLRVIPAEGGTLGRMIWQHSAGVQIEAIGSPTGRPGMSELRRLLMVAVQAMGQITEQTVTDPAATVVTSVEAVTGGPVWSPLPGGNPRWLAVFVVGVRPGLA